MNHLAIVRSCSTPLNLKRYNIQEIGLAKSLLKIRNNLQIDFYSKFANMERWEEKQYGRLRLINTPLLALPGNQGFSFLILTKLTKNNYNYIQIHDDSQLLNLLIIFFNKLIYKKVIILYQGMYEPYSGFPRLFQIIYNFLFMKFFCKNVGITLAKTYYAKQYLENLGFSNVKIVPVGIDINKILNYTEIVDKKINSFINSHDFILIYIGVFEKRRNVPFTIKVFEMCKTLIGGAGLVLVGNGPDKAKISSLINNSSFKNSILCINSIEHNKIANIYKTCSCFLLPTLNEIYGMVILECVLFGLPIITTDNAGSNQIKNITNWEGLFIEELNPKKWVDLIKSIVTFKKSHFIKSADKIKHKLYWDNSATLYLKATKI